VPSIRFASGLDCDKEWKCAMDGFFFAEVSRRRCRMKRFEYEAMDSSGGEVHGFVEAATETEALRIMREQRHHWCTRWLTIDGAAPVAAGTSSSIVRLGRALIDWVRSAGRIRCEVTAAFAHQPA
jgi:hypothetical protein